MAVNVDEGVTENLSTDVNIPEDHEGSESGSTVSFDVGEKFLSYEALKDKVSAYECSRNVQLCHSDSRTLEAAKKRAPRKVALANDALVYYSINLSCVFGGKKYHSKGHGKRPHQRYVSIYIYTSNLAPPLLCSMGVNRVC